MRSSAALVFLSLVLLSFGTSPVLAASSADAVRAAKSLVTQHGMREPGCTIAQEYITTLEFLRDRRELEVPEKEAREMAEKVAAGCTGSAKRFIRVAQVVSKAGLSAHDAVKTGLEFVTRTDREAETFITVFQKSFLKEYLDLDLRAAMRMAHALSTQFEGDQLAVRGDFERLVEYCVGATNLDLPRPECGAWAARIARQGDRFSGGVAEPYLAIFEFARSGEPGPGLTTGNALKLAEELVAFGPGVDQNFIRGYRYAASPSGLALTQNDALAFARRMALGTQHVPGTPAGEARPPSPKKSTASGPSPR